MNYSGIITITVDIVDWMVVYQIRFNWTGPGKARLDLRDLDMA